MNKIYLINNKTSEIPAYWTAKFTNGLIVNQINHQGEISEKWSTLPVDDLEYWGIVSNFGNFGFYLNENMCDVNGLKFKYPLNTLKKISYKRTVLCSSDGLIQTKSIKISLHNQSIQLLFFPEIKIVLSIDDK